MPRYLLLLGSTQHASSLDSLLSVSEIWHADVISIIIPGHCRPGGAGMSSLAGVYNWHHAAMWMHVFSGSSFTECPQNMPVLPTASRPVPTLVLLVPSRWSENNKRQLHHPSYSLGCPHNWDWYCHATGCKICIKLVNKPCSVRSQPALWSTFRPTAASAFKQHAIAQPVLDQFVSIEPRFGKRTNFTTLIPTTSSPNERLFSTAGDMIT